MQNARMHVIAGLALTMVLGGIPSLTGCDKTKAEHETEVTHPNGSTETEKSKTVEKPNGSMETKTEKTTSGPTP